MRNTSTALAGTGERIAECLTSQCYFVSVHVRSILKIMYYSADARMGVCRARRNRKQIDYSGNAYDNMMRAAIMRQGRNQQEEGASRRMAMQDDRYSTTPSEDMSARSVCCPRKPPGRCLSQ